MIEALTSWRSVVPGLVASALVIVSACGPSGPPASARSAEGPVAVALSRVPDGGVQPEVAVDPDGTVHLVYLTGEPSAADVFYARSTDGGRSFADAVRVNSQPHTAIATGTVRGAQIAVGGNGRVHVAWNGSPTADGMPLFYARSDPATGVFEAQRNLLTRTTNLDGGGSIAAGNGHVFVAWHANMLRGPADEESRRVFLARSDDDGATFGVEVPVSDPATGVCGCCAVRLQVDPGGTLQLLYRSATDVTHRDMYWLSSDDGGDSFAGGSLDAWEIGACPMTTSAIAASDAGSRVAWETDGQVFLGIREPGASLETSPPPGDNTSGRKHPRLGSQPDGTTLLAWTEGTAWARGGSIAWQVFDAAGRPTDVAGSAPELPVWSFANVVARPDGGFTVIY